MTCREKRILNAVNELLSRFPYDFRADYEFNKKQLRENTEKYFVRGRPAYIFVGTTFLPYEYDDSLDAKTIRKIAGALTHEIGIYEQCNPNWQDEMARKRFVAGASGSGSPGRKRKAKKRYYSFRRRR